ncbi:MAG: hypothetical protein AAB036_06845 [Elusimicrobiota bacterium]
MTTAVLLPILVENIVLNSHIADETPQYQARTVAAVRKGVVRDRPMIDFDILWPSVYGRIIAHGSIDLHPGCQVIRKDVVRECNIAAIEIYTVISIACGDGTLGTVVKLAVMDEPVPIKQNPCPTPEHAVAIVVNIIPPNRNVVASIDFDPFSTIFQFKPLNCDPSDRELGACWVENGDTVRILRQLEPLE